MQLSEKVVKHSVWISQNNVLGWVREISLSLESGASVYIGFPPQRPDDWLQFVEQNTNLFMQRTSSRTSITFSKASPLCTWPESLSNTVANFRDGSVSTTTLSSGVIHMLTSLPSLPGGWETTARIDEKAKIWYGPGKSL